MHVNSQYHGLSTQTKNQENLDTALAAGTGTRPDACAQQWELQSAS